MSKVNIRSNFELKSAEASVLILNVLKREGFYEDDVRGFIVWVTDGIQNKVTIHEKEIFEKKIIEIIQKYKEELQKKDYCEVREKVIELFRDKRKNKILRFIDRHPVLVSAAAPSLVTLLVFVIELITKCSK